MAMAKTPPVKQSIKGYGKYDRNRLSAAYEDVVNKKLSIRRSAIVHGVPKSTLMDRISGRVSEETKRVSLLSKVQEKVFVQHLQKMTAYGYGYSRNEVIKLFSEYAHKIGKKDKGKLFTPKWFYAFLRRWPELKLIKPTSLEKSRAISISKEVFDSFLKELQETINTNGLESKPQNIYSIEETVIISNQRTPKIDCKSKTTIIASGSAVGQTIPPYIIFEGKHLHKDIQKSASPGTTCCVSDNGLSNSDLFDDYLKQHFSKFVISNDANNKILILVNGYMSHISLPLIEWAADNNIILLVLPVYTSLFLQPLHNSCFKPLQKGNNEAVDIFTSEKDVSLSIHDNCHKFCHEYNAAMTPNNLIERFRKAGFYPINRKKIKDKVLKPSQLLNHVDSKDEREEKSNNENIMEIEQILQTQFHKSRCKHLNKIKSGENIATVNVKRKIAQVDGQSNVKRYKGASKGCQTELKKDSLLEIHQNVTPLGKNATEDYQNVDEDDEDEEEGDEDEETDEEMDETDMVNERDSTDEVDMDMNGVVESPTY